MPYIKTSVPGVWEYRNKSNTLVSFVFKTKVKDGVTGKFTDAKTTVPASKYQELTPAKLKKELQKDFEDWKSSAQQDTERGGVTVPKDITLEDLVNHYWIKDCVKDGKHAANTIAQYTLLAKHITEYFGKTRVRDITPISATRFLNHMRETELTIGKDKKQIGYSDRAQKEIARLFNNIMLYAIGASVITENPYDKVQKSQRPKIKKRRLTEEDFLTPEEAKAFLNALNKERPFWKAYGYTLIFTGLRRGEALALQWQDIDFTTHEIHVYKSVTRDTTKAGKQDIKTPKTDESTRFVPMNKTLESILLELKTEQAKHFRCIIPQDGFVFSNMKDFKRPAFINNPTRWMREFTEKNGLKNVSPHDLRHTAATLALESGADLKQIQSLLGHRDAATTMNFYAGITAERERETVDGIEELLTEKKAN